MSYRAVTLVIATLSAIVGYALKLQCQVVSASSLFPEVFRTCYSDVSALYGARDFDLGIIPYFELQTDGQFLEYPVLIGIQMLITSIITNAISPGSWQIFTYFNWAINLVFIVLAVWYLDKINPRAARWFAFSPALLLVLGINWDALAVLLLVLGIYFFSHQRHVAFGVTLGLGMSAKLFPILLLPVALIYLLEKKDFKAMMQSTFSAALAWISINVPFIVFAFDGWIRFFEFSRERGVDFGSPYLALFFLTDIKTPTSLANTLGLISVAITYVVIFALRKKLDFLIAVTLVLTVFVVINKVYSPQFWIWLAPLFALVIADRWQWIGWNIAQTLYYFAVWAFIASYVEEEYSLSESAYAVFIVIHVLSTILVLVGVLKSAIGNQPQQVHDPSHL